MQLIVRRVKPLGLQAKKLTSFEKRPGGTRSPLSRPSEVGRRRIPPGAVADGAEPDTLSYWPSTCLPDSPADAG